MRYHYGYSTQENMATLDCTGMCHSGICNSGMSLEEEEEEQACQLMKHPLRSHAYNKNKF